jgi:site-specific recombinase XerD
MARKIGQIFRREPSTRLVRIYVGRDSDKDTKCNFATDFRHTTASRLVMRGVHVSLVQKIMGHRWLRMTFRYAHLAAHLLEAVRKIVPERRPFFGD